MLNFTESPSNSAAPVQKELNDDDYKEGETPGAAGDKEGKTPAEEEVTDDKAEEEVTDDKEGETPSEKEAPAEKETPRVDEEETSPTNTPSLRCSYKRCSNKNASKEQYDCAAPSCTKKITLPASITTCSKVVLTSR